MRSNTIGIATEILDSLISAQTQVIGVTGQMHGIVYVDDKGNHLSPLYTWQDGRGNQAFGNTTYADYLGCSSGYGHVTDFYNRENNLVPEQASSLCTIHDYFVMRLCGLTKPLVHATDAASFGLLDLKEKRFTCDKPEAGEQIEIRDHTLKENIWLSVLRCTACFRQDCARI